MSPINGVPIPTGRPFTSETAREARRKRTEKEQQGRSIAKSFLTYLGEIVTRDEDGTEYTGAQAIAMAIIRGAIKGNPELIKIALSLCGETPSTKISVSTGQLADLIDGLKEPLENDLHEEATGLDGAMADE